MENQLELFRTLLNGLDGYEKLSSALLAGRCPVLATGLNVIHKCHIAAALWQDSGRGMVIVTSDEPSANRMAEDINSFTGREAALLYPYRDFTFRQVDGVSREYEHARLKVLEGMSQGGCPIVVASAQAALQYTIPLEKLQRSTLRLRTGEQRDMNSLLAFLSFSGYERAERVEGVCQFSQRGGILDVFPPQAENPVRIEFWDEDIDSISTFLVDTQRRVDTLEEVWITPAREALFDSEASFVELLRSARKTIRGKNAAKIRENLDHDIQRIESGLPLEYMDRYLPLLYPQPATLLDYLQCPYGEKGESRFLVINESVNIRENLRNANWQLQEDIKGLFEEGILFRGCDTFNREFTDLAAAASRSSTVILDTFGRTLAEIPLRELIEIQCLQLSAWSGELELLKEEVEGYLHQGYTCLVMAGTARFAASIARDLQDHGVRADYVESLKAPVPGRVYLMEGILGAGLEYPENKTVVFSYSRTASSGKKRRAKYKPGEQIRSLSDLNFGDPVVHMSHGIGIFQGIVKQEMQGITKDYIQIKYAGSDTLFVPVTQLDLISRYIGPRENGSLRLNKLNSADWVKTKQRVRSAVKDMAKELIALYAKRAQERGFAFSPDTEWQKEFEERFPYDETDDQLRCIDEIKADMEQVRPMERLLCGDVGYGKTEVALRAVFKAVMDSKQVAVLVPTTILAWQHYNTFRSRLENFPVKVEILSRYRTAKQQKQILRELARGEIEIIIGTHRLLQKDVEFKDLGLVVIDEEQRFGVAHKERLKEMKHNVDVLTLSATPIPRTLNMAMSGVRDMSVIEEAPANRHPVQTYVLEHDWGILAEAIKRELRRGGQAFYLHNNIATLDQCAGRISALIPEARIVIAHGQMAEEQLSKTWQMLMDHEVDILVCTTIIETGVDVANCNTLIVENADHMGLSQLYQLRGRVGRSSRRAFAYLTFQAGKEITEISAKRLAAIREFTSFGSGFRIAMRDLEIRGAGNILGAQQHGHMESVGYDMYVRMLSEAVQEQKGEKPPTSMEEECLIDIRVGAHIPESYIDSLSNRIDIYKKIAGIRGEEDAMDITDELIDRFGEPPKAVKGLIDVALVRNLAMHMGIYEISQGEDKLTFFTHNLDMNRIGALSAKFPGRVTAEAVDKSCIHLKMERGEQPLELLREALLCMKEAQDRMEKAAAEGTEATAPAIKVHRSEKKTTSAMEQALEMQKKLTEQKKESARQAAAQRPEKSRKK